MVLTPSEVDGPYGEQVMLIDTCFDGEWLDWTTSQFTWKATC